MYVLIRRRGYLQTCKLGYKLNTYLSTSSTFSRGP